MRAAIAIAAVLTAFAAGIFVGAHPTTPIVGPLKDIVAPDQATIDTEEAKALIEQEFYRPVPGGALRDGSIGGMVKALRDPYSVYFTPKLNREFKQVISGKYSGIGVAVNDDKRGLVVGVVYPGTPAKAAGMKVNDVIVEVNGKSIAGQPAEAAVTKVKGPEGTFVELGVRSPATGSVKKLGSLRKLRIQRKSIDTPVTTGKIVTRAGRKTGVIELLSFTETAGAAVAREIEKLTKRGAKSWVLDLRGNGGGRLDQTVDVCSLFLRKGMVVATDGRGRSRRQYNVNDKLFMTADPLVVLVDRHSASASEITAGTLKYSDRALVVGTRTYGKGVFQEVTELDSGGAVSLTVGRYVLPGNHSIGKGGLKPDLVASDKRSTKPDEALEASLAALARFKQK